jgi:uncharacterized protein YcfL
MKTTMSFLILLLAVSGCVPMSQTTQPVYPAVPPRQAVVDKRVVIDPTLENIIQIVGVKSTLSTDGFLKIQVDVQSMIDSPKQFNYRIDWFDREGQELPMAASATMSWMLLSHETSFLAATSPTPAARDFRITFLGPDN